VRGRARKSHDITPTLAYTLYKHIITCIFEFIPDGVKKINKIFVCPVPAKNHPLGWKALA
jgi:hypothetical protein